MGLGYMIMGHVINMQRTTHYRTLHLRTVIFRTIAPSTCAPAETYIPGYVFRYRVLIFLGRRGMFETWHLTSAAVSILQASTRAVTSCAVVGRGGRRRW